MGTKRLWAVRAGNAGQADSIFLEQDHVAISSQNVMDDVGQLPASRGAFRELIARHAPQGRTGAIPIQAGQLYRFVHEVRIGDHVLYPRKCDRVIHWGEIAGPYFYNTDVSPEFAHRRAVRWHAALSRDVFSQSALFELGSALSLFEITSHATEFQQKFSAQSGAVVQTSEDFESAEEFGVRDVSETTSDFIARKLKTHFKGYPLEPLVAELFRAMGYRARTTRASRDEGVDVIAHRDELGIEPPIIKIQVKAHEANIGSDAVKAFYAMVHDRDVGIFITTSNYTIGARDFARSKANLKLVTGVELVGLIQKYYDNMALKYRQQIPLRRVLVPDAEADVA
jgi:restriction system protein